LIKFWDNLGHFDLFWDFDSLSKMKQQAKKILRKLDPLFGSFLGFWDNVMGKGCWPMGLPMFRPTFVCINRRIGNVRIERWDFLVQLVVHICDVV
jgi:hypothetical protein